MLLVLLDRLSAFTEALRLWRLTAWFTAHAMRAACPPAGEGERGRR